MMPNQILLELPWMEGRLWKPFLFGTALRGRKVAQKKHYIWNCPGWNCPGWKKVCKKKLFFWNYPGWKEGFESTSFWELPWTEGRLRKKTFFRKSHESKKGLDINIYPWTALDGRKVAFNNFILNTDPISPQPKASQDWTWFIFTKPSWTLLEKPCAQTLQDKPFWMMTKDPAVAIQKGGWLKQSGMWR